MAPSTTAFYTPAPLQPQTAAHRAAPPHAPLSRPHPLVRPRHATTRRVLMAVAVNDTPRQANSSSPDPPPWPGRGTEARAKRSARRAGPATIVCVGDVHGDWGAGDESALLALAPDLVLFVGDYGNEDIDLTKRIRRFADAAPFGVATVFGNHDAHYTASLRRRIRSPYGAEAACRVSAQMRALAPYDVSYRSASFEPVALSVCGGRSFSWGGPQWKHAAFFRRFLGVHGMDDSASKISAAAADARFQTVVFLSHSGPSGLGDRPRDPCGKDWGDQPGGDYGDADLRTGIERARAYGLRVPLAVFGHMHKALQAEQGERVMVKTEPDGGDGRHTVMVNAAVVPRHRPDGRGQTMHHFQVVHMAEGGDVLSVEETWVRACGALVDVATIYQAEGVAEATSESSGSPVLQ